VTRPPVVVGTVLVAVGALLLLDELGTVDAGRVLSTWWPLAVVAAGLLRWARPPRSIGGGALLVATGLVLQLWRLDVISDLSLLWPVLLLTLGGWLLLSPRVRQRSWSTAGAVGDDFDAVTVFGDRRTLVKPGRFTGGSVVTVFGDADVDLTATTIDDRAAIDGVTVFGDVDLVVPPHWHVTSDGLTLLGDVNVAPPTAAADGGDAPELRLDLVTVFGDVKVTRGTPAPGERPTAGAAG
jgi:predicted membrane protein